MTNRIVQRGKNYLVRSSRYAPLFFINKRVYDAMELVIRSTLGNVSGVRAIYLCHGLANGEIYPGLSDFDLAVVFEDPDPLTFYDRFRRKWRSLKKVLPVADLSLMTTREFEEWQNIGGGWDPLDEVRHWRLLTGTELRHDNAALDTDHASMDRMQWALGHFQNLMSVAIREEPKSPLMAIVARRQLHKCFWNAIIATDPRYMAISGHRARTRAWMAEHEPTPEVAAIQEMYENRFTSGPVSTLRFDVTALAWNLLDGSLEQHPLVNRALPIPVSTGDPMPIANAAEVEERMNAYRDSILEMIAAGVESIILSSTGTIRGYALYIVLRDMLSPSEIADALRDIRAVHRVFDDPWFNEHFPAGIPIVCSPAMFRARLQTGRSSLHYFHFFRRVLYGRDLYAEAIESSAAGDVIDTHADDWRRERLIYSLSLHQIYLARLKSALHDYVTFYYPRMALQRETDSAPATAEQAVAEYAARHDDEPMRMLKDYRGKDLDVLLRTVPIDAFNRAWPMLNNGLV
jgi:predicted nucleotidyltransferase